MTKEYNNKEKLRLEGWTFDGLAELFVQCGESKQSKLNRAKQNWFEKEDVPIEELRNSARDLILLAYE